MIVPEHCSLFNYPIYPEPSSIETIYGGKKIVRTNDTNEAFLAFDKNEIEYERMMLVQFKESEIFSQSSINFRLWIEQRLKVIENFISEYHNNA